MHDTWADSDPDTERSHETQPPRLGDPGFGSVKDTPVRKVARRTAGHTRMVAAIPAFGFLVCAVVLAVIALVDVFSTTMEYVEGHLTIMELATEYVEHADLFLLAVVLDILSLGLISLFITDRLSLPRWLTFHDLDDLKERLVSVIGVMLGVYFLGYVLEGARGIDVLWMGLGCSVVTVALAFFVRNVFKGHE